MRKPCCDKQGNNKGAWSKQEDQKLIDYIKTHGEGCWRSLPKAAGLHRCGKSCRLRWINYLRPDIKRGNFAQDEEDLIIKLHALLGNRWSLIAGRLPGRTDNEVKNYWNSHLKKKLIKMGIDPKNHKLNMLSRPQPSEHVAVHATTSPTPANKNNNCKTETSKSQDNDRASDTASCLEDNNNIHEQRISRSSCCINLNLDLAIAIPSDSSPVMNMDSARVQPSCRDFTTLGEVESEGTPTLVLFR